MEYQGTLSGRPARAAAILIGFGVLALTALCAGKAYATVTVANSVEFTLSAPNPGNVSTSFTLPVTNAPVIVNAACLSSGAIGVAHVTMVFNGSHLAWSGQDGAGTTTANIVGATDQHVADVAFTGTIQLRVSTTALNKLVIRNNSSEFGGIVVVQEIW